VEAPAHGHRFRGAGAARDTL